MAKGVPLVSVVISVPPPALVTVPVEAAEVIKMPVPVLVRATVPVSTPLVRRVLPLVTSIVPAVVVAVIPRLVAKLVLTRKAAPLLIVTTPPVTVSPKLALALTCRIPPPTVVADWLLLPFKINKPSPFLVSARPAMLLLEDCVRVRLMATSMFEAAMDVTSLVNV